MKQPIRVFLSRHRRFLFLLFSLFSLGIMIAIFCFSAQTADSSSKTSGSFILFWAKIFRSDFGALPASAQLDAVATVGNLVRKLAHAGIYASLGFFSCGAVLCAAWPRKLSQKSAVTAVFTLLYAVSDELHQLFVPGRGCELRDVLIDFGGACAGITVMLLIYWLLTKRKKV